VTARTVAAFDFDGTLTRRDTLLPFLRRTRGASRTSIAMLANSLVLARGVVASDDQRDAAKAAVLRRLLAGQDVEELRAAADVFADVVIKRGLRAPVLDRVRSHESEGHELVIVTASPELYVGPIGERLGFDAVLGTRLQTDGNGRLTGSLEGRNCRGAEKVERLRAWLGEGEVTVHAYGDSSGDRQLWEFADHAYRVRGDRLLVVGVSA
jgi:phosphatidylglycerophosphatase C